MGKRKGKAGKAGKARRGAGEGGVRYREDKGLWEGTVSLGKGADGRRVRATVYGKDKREALELMAEARSRAGRTAPPVPPTVPSVTLGEALRRWLDSREGSDAPATLEARHDSVRLHLLPAAGGLELSSLTPLAVEGVHAAVRAAGAGPFALEAAASALRSALAWCVGVGLLRSNPASRATRPRRPRREMACLSAAGCRALLAAAAGLPTADLIALALATGLRQGELLALHWGDVDLAAGVLHVRRTLSRTRRAGAVLKEPKTASGLRSVALPAETARMLAARLARARAAGLAHAPVFCTRQGKFLMRRNVCRAFAAVVDRANDPRRPRSGGRPRAGAGPQGPRERTGAIPEGLRFHDLRHTSASLLISQGGSILAVSRRLGHSKPSTTLNLYGHLMPADDAKLAAVLDAAILAAPRPDGPV